MKKKILATVLAAAMALSLAACGDTNESSTQASTTSTTSTASTEKTEASTEYTADDPGGVITVWAAENIVEFTKGKAEEYLAANYPNWTVVVEAVGEGDAAGNMITDVEGGADLFGFAQDQLSRLVSAGAVMPITGDYASWIQSENAGGATAAATVGDVVYAFPMTADNGYFLYYDSSVITDPTTLESILEQCEAAGKNFYFDLGSWYNSAFFFGAGCECYYDTDSDGNFTDCHVNYASDEGLLALKAMIKMVESSCFQAGSSVSNAVEWAAIVDGTWDSGAAKEVLGDNYACAKLPTVTVDGTTFQMGGFNGLKLLGVKPQEDATKLQVCLGLAQYLTNEECQLGRFNEFGWGPSNVAAQQNDAVKADPALAALNEQFEYTVGQGQYPGDFWSTGLDGDLTAGTLNSGMSDAELMDYLTKLQDLLAAAR